MDWFLAIRKKWSRDTTVLREGPADMMMVPHMGGLVQWQGGQEQNDNIEIYAPSAYIRDVGGIFRDTLDN